MNNSIIEDLRNQMLERSQSLTGIINNIRNVLNTTQIESSQESINQTNSNNCTTTDSLSIYFTDDNCTIVRKILYNHPEVLIDLIGNFEVKSEKTIFIRFARLLKEIIIKYPILQSLVTLNNFDSQQYIFQQIQNKQDLNLLRYADLILANKTWIKTNILNDPNESESEVVSFITNKNNKHTTFNLNNPDNNNNKTMNSEYNINNLTSNNASSILTINKLLDTLNSIRNLAVSGQYDKDFDKSVGTFTEMFQPRANSSMIEDDNEVIIINDLINSNKSTLEYKDNSYIEEIEKDLRFLINWSRYEAVNKNYTSDIDIEIERNLAHVLNKSVPLWLIITKPNQLDVQQTEQQHQTISNQSNRKLKARLQQTELHLKTLEKLLENFNSILVNILEKSYRNEIDTEDSEKYSTPLTSPTQF